MQAQANLLKSLAVTGAPTKIITVGIGFDISPEELRRLASPGPGNSLLFPDLRNTALLPFEQELVNAIFGKINLLLNYNVVLTAKCLLRERARERNPSLPTSI